MVSDPYNYLLPAPDIIRLQRIQNEKAEELHQRSRFQNLTIQGALEEMLQTVRWLLEDFVNMPKKNLIDAFTQHQRLRGLGLLFMFLSSLMLVVDALG